MKQLGVFLVLKVSVRDEWCWRPSPHHSLTGEPGLNLRPLQRPHLVRAQVLLLRLGFKSPSCHWLPLSHRVRHYHFPSSISSSVKKMGWIVRFPLFLPLVTFHGHFSFASTLSTLAHTDSKDPDERRGLDRLGQEGTCIFQNEWNAISWEGVRFFVCISLQDFSEPLISKYTLEAHWL